MTTETDDRIATLIADRLANGLFHPGDIEAEQEPTTIRLPMFRTVGAPPEVHQQVDMTVKLIAEAIVHLIKTDGQCNLTDRDIQIGGAEETPLEEPQ